MHRNKTIFVIKLNQKEIKMLKNLEVLLAPAKKIAELNKVQIEKAIAK